MSFLRVAAILAVVVFSTAGAQAGPQYDVIIRGGTVYDGSGGRPVVGDVALRGDSIVAIGRSITARGRKEINARGLAVAPGFINMLSWANESLIEDGRSQSDIRQGVTLEVMGEGESMGPLTDSMKTVILSQQSDIKYPVTWTTLGGYLDTLVAKGISTNVASFVGATTIREHVIGWDDRPPTPAELTRMQALVREAMEEGALGVGSSLIYAPAFYAKTDELIALVKAAAPYGGMYVSHMRSEGNRLLEAVDELLAIAREGGVRAEIYHLKAAGQSNWPKMDRVLAKVDSARAAGVAITANIYPYPAGATGLDASMPPWVQEGGYTAWAKRLQDPAIRARVKQEMTTPTDKWESLYLAAGSPDRIILVAFKADSLKKYTGKTLAEVAKMRGSSPEHTAMDLVIRDGTRVGTIYFLMSEDNIKKELARPWVSVGSDEGSYEPAGVFLQSNPHPRAYGSFARVLGKYSRDEKLIPLEEAIRRLTVLPATNLRIQRRGKLAAGYYGDVVVFDPAKIIDHATFEKPHQYATGMVHVFVNGVQVLANGEHTGAKPGRVVRGPGWKGKRQAQEHHSQPQKLGTVRFTTSCNAAAQPHFNRAVALLHSFGFPHAVEGFNATLAADPKCSMAYWGIALSAWGNPFVAGAKPTEQLQRGLDAIRLAKTVGTPTTRERGYIDAVAKLYENYETVAQGTRLLSYRDAMAALAAREPTDSEAQIFYALALAISAPPTDKTYTSQLKAGALLERLSITHPDHPGLAHYIIHSYDVPPLASRALAAARRYSRIAPAAPHALHMPSHTFTRVGYWQESIDGNIESAAAAKRERSTAEELHASDYQMYAYLQTGQDKAATRLLDALPEIARRFDPTQIGTAAPPAAGFFAIAAIPARFALERGEWAKAMRLEPHPSAFLPAEAVTHFARALGAARMGDTTVLKAAVEALQQIRDRLAHRNESYWSEQVEIQRRGASAWLAFVEGRKKDAVAEMRAAAEREDATEKNAITPGPIAPARELLGVMLLQSGEPRLALKEFEATLRKEPRRFRALAGAAEAATAAGDRAAARSYYSQLLKITARADKPGRPELTAARRSTR